MSEFGITRFHITKKINGRGAYRFEDSKQRWDMANELYRHICTVLKMPLIADERIVEGDEGELAQVYDREFGVDVLLKFENGMQIAMQEKYLFTSFDTVTVEYMNNPDIDDKGDWFNMRAQWYFVGYDEYKRFQWDRWILLNWASVQLLTARGAIPWQDRRNQNDGAKASFRYARMAQFPTECVIASSLQPRFAPRPAGIADQLPLWGY